MKKNNFLENNFPKENSPKENSLKKNTKKFPRKNIFRKKQIPRNEKLKKKYTLKICTFVKKKISENKNYSETIISTKTKINIKKFHQKM